MNDSYSLETHLQMLKEILELTEGAAERNLIRGKIIEIEDKLRKKKMEEQMIDYSTQELEDRIEHWKYVLDNTISDEFRAIVEQEIRILEAELAGRTQRQKWE